MLQTIINKLKESSKMSSLIKAGETFRVFNGDATGTVKSVLPAGTGVQGNMVTYVFDHDLEKVYVTDERHFNSFTYPYSKPVKNSFPHAAYTGFTAEERAAINHELAMSGIDYL